MTELWRDGFDHGIPIANRYTSNGTVSINAAYARTGAFGARFHASGSAVGTTKRQVLAAQEHATFIIGGAIKVDTLVAGLGFMSDAAATAHICVVVEINGSLTVRRGTFSGTVLATSDVSAWNRSGTPFHYLELKATLHDTTGAYTVRVDGVAIASLTATGVDTKNGGTKAVFDSFCYYGGIDGFFDDIYVANAAGSVNNDFYGDTECIWLPVTGDDATYSGFTPSTGTSHYVLVNEVPPNTTNYVSHATDGTIDLYTLADLTNTSGIIHSATEHINSAKVGTEVKYVRPARRVAGTTYEGTSLLLSTSYTNLMETWELNPATSALWLPAAINALEIGYLAKDS